MPPRLKMDLREEDLSLMIEGGINNLVEIAKDSNSVEGYKKFLPYISAFLLSLTDEQFFIWKSTHEQYAYNPADSDDILYFSEEFKESLDKIQT